MTISNFRAFRKLFVFFFLVNYYFIRNSITSSSRKKYALSINYVWLDYRRDCKNETTQSTNDIFDQKKIILVFLVYFDWFIVMYKIVIHLKIKSILQNIVILYDFLFWFKQFVFKINIKLFVRQLKNIINYVKNEKLEFRAKRNQTFVKKLKIMIELIRLRKQFHFRNCIAQFHNAMKIITYANFWNHYKIVRVQFNKRERFHVYIIEQFFRNIHDINNFKFFQIYYIFRLRDSIFVK